MGFGRLSLLLLGIGSVLFTFTVYSSYHFSSLSAVRVVTLYKRRQQIYD